MAINPRNDLTKYRYHYGILEVYNTHQEQWQMANDDEARVIGMPKRKMK